MNILLVGQPNVGKSVVFTRLTGVDVISSNYPGTTVEFTEGFMPLGNERARIIDVPGIYSLETPTSKAEEIAAEMLKDGDIVVNVVDSTNLERNLRLTLQLMERNKRMVVALNIWDDAKHKGIDIDYQKLERLLGVPVIPTVAITGEGIKELVTRIPHAVSPQVPARDENTRWTEVGHIVDSVQTVRHRHHTFLEWLGDCSVKPTTGLFVAAIVLSLSFFTVRFIGEGITARIMEPIFDNLWQPLMMKISSALGGSGIIHNLLIGKLIEGNIDFIQSFGLLTTGLFIEFAIVMPYLLAFYLLLGILEDFGYLPRLAVLLDRVLHKVGLHGWAIVPNILGLGCNVPAILATRVLESPRERFIAATLVSIAVPCAALQAMIWALVGDPARGGGVGYVLLVYGTLIIAWLLIGRILNKLLSGKSPELLMEIPPYRLPSWRAVLTKLWLRLKSFIVEALPIVMLGVLIVNLVYSTAALDGLSSWAAPVMTRLLGLPEEALTALLVGFLRKDMAMGLLGNMGLTIKQLVVASTVLAMSFPCIASFAVLAKELGLRDMLKSAGIMVLASLIAGGILNALL